MPASPLLGSFSTVFGKARVNRLEMESTTMRLVFGGGNKADVWISKASKCGKVGTLKWWKRSNTPFGGVRVGVGAF